jgi:long-chain acyl-CoA synthetase
MTINRTAMIDYVDARIARHGDRTALICRDGFLTYAELDATVSRVAAGLARCGVRPGERVTLFSENRWEWVAAYHGILRAGCVVNPVNAMLTSPELAVIVEDCGSTALFASGACTERIGTGLPASVRLRVSFGSSPSTRTR